MSERPKPLCFVAMPFGRRRPLTGDGPEVDFDRIWTVLERTIFAADLEPQRADFQPGGGFVHRPMYESLMVAEFVVADLTFANANVAYEVGVRHGAMNRPTILVGADGFLGELPFDFAPLRVLPYRLDAEGRLPPDATAPFEQALRTRLEAASGDRGGSDNPIVQITGWAAGRLEHDKTDVFLSRFEYATAVNQRIRDALLSQDSAAAVRELGAVERELLDGSHVVAQLHSGLMAVYLGYREHEAWQAMVDMFPQLPRELQATAVALEQLALAYNRLAEDADRRAEAMRGRGDAGGAGEAVGAADVLRARALGAAALPPDLVTAETYGVRGRIQKGRYHAAVAAGDAIGAEVALNAAIDAYEDGLVADMRDYYPGINAVTLRLVRGTDDDHARLVELLPVVRMAADVAPAPRTRDERYWRAATKLEVASAAKDFRGARRHLLDALGAGPATWMRATTVDNLRIHAAAFADDAAAVAAIDEWISALTQRQLR